MGASGRKGAGKVPYSERLQSELTWWTMIHVRTFGTGVLGPDRDVAVVRQLQMIQWVTIMETFNRKVSTL